MKKFFSFFAISLLLGSCAFMSAVAPTPPQDLWGRIHRLNHRKGKNGYVARGYWKKSSSQDVHHYNVYSEDTVIKVVPASGKLTFRLLQVKKRLRSPIRVSAVNFAGEESCKRKIHFEKFTS